MKVTRNHPSHVPEDLVYHLAYTQVVSWEQHTRWHPHQFLFKVVIIRRFSRYLSYFPISSRVNVKCVYILCNAYKRDEYIVEVSYHAAYVLPWSKSVISCHASDIRSYIPTFCVEVETAYWIIVLITSHAYARKTNEYTQHEKYTTLYKWIIWPSGMGVKRKSNALWAVWSGWR